MQIRRPGEEHANGGEDAHGEEGGEVAWPRRGRGGVDDESDGCDRCGEGYKGAVGVVVGGEEADEEDDQEAEDVGRGREAVGGYCGERAHFGNNGGEEEGKRGEGDIAR